MNLSDKHIAILGGMGPQASALLQLKLVKALTDLGVAECSEFPLISQISLPVKDFISDPAGRFQNTKMVKDALAALNFKNIDRLIVACNTAHLLVDEIEDFDQLPVVSLPDSVIEVALESGAESLGLLASPTTIKTKLYENRSKGRLDIITPSVAEQKEVETVIRRTIAGRNDGSDLKKIMDLAEKLFVRGADMVALGCTELSVAAETAKDERLIDSLDASAEALLKGLAAQKEVAVK